MAWMWINFPFITPAKLFMLSRFVIKCAWSFATCDKLCSPCWNSFRGQALPETFQAISLMAWFTNRGYAWLLGWLLMFLIWGRSWGSVTHNSRTWLYQGCANQLGVIKITSTFSVLILIELSLSLKKGEKHSVAHNVSNSVAMHLLISYVDLLSTTGKMRVSDGMLLMQKDATLEIPTLHKFLITNL